MDVGLISSALGSLNAAGQIAAGLIKLKSTTDVQAQAIELNERILAAQAQLFQASATQAELIEQVRALEGQVAAMKAWEAQKQRYQLATPFTGAMVYALKKTMSNGEPAHYICARCYEDGKRSILQDLADKDRWHGYACPTCKSVAPTGGRGPRPAMYAEEVVTQ